MIPRIQTGKSFKGAALYYLHDKSPENGPKLSTNERVAWTHTLNCVDNDPEQAIKEMQHTCLMQDYLKKASGHAIGRPTKEPVITVALSWPPDMHPTQRDMIDGAKDFLNAMGWQELQVLMTAHNDTKHAHVHLIINRVHPETGIAADMAWYKNRAQDWGLKFEREHGHIYCLKRVENERDRQHDRPRGKERAFAHYGEWRTANHEMNREGIFAPENAELATSAEWASLRKEQKEERMAFWKENSQQFKQLRREAYAQVKEEFAEHWREYEKTAAAARLAIKERQAETDRLCRYYTRQGRTGTKPSYFERVRRYHTWQSQIPARSSHFESVTRARQAQDAYAKEQLSALRHQRDSIKKAMRKRFDRLSEFSILYLKEDRDKEYQRLLARQREDKQGLKNDQAKARRRYDLLASFGRDQLKPVQVVLDLNAGQLRKDDLGRYLKRATEALSRSPFERAPSKHFNDHNFDDAVQRAKEAIRKQEAKTREERRRKRAASLGRPPVSCIVRPAALELTRGGTGSLKEKQQGHDQARTVAVAQKPSEQIRQAALEVSRQINGKQQDTDGRYDHSDKQDRTVATAQKPPSNSMAEQIRRAAEAIRREEEQRKHDLYSYRDGRREHTAEGLNRGDKGGGRGR